MRLRSISASLKLPKWPRTVWGCKVQLPGRSSGYLSARSCAVTSVRCAAPGSRWRTGQDGYPFNWSWVSANTFSSTTC
ncbi:phage exclusion lipoprotein Cor, partial [Enterobacter roggenkampii]|uniref:phage exclusion lipoprotein Cor n=1 Tax=Enterobacter roggenkampii TaxID=1812935 RepID=UPI0039C87C41